MQQNNQNIILDNKKWGQVINNCTSNSRRISRIQKLQEKYCLLSVIYKEFTERWLVLKNKDDIEY